MEPTSDHSPSLSALNNLFASVTSAPFPGSSDACLTRLALPTHYDNVELLPKIEKKLVVTCLVALEFPDFIGNLNLELDD